MMFISEGIGNYEKGVGGAEERFTIYFTDVLILIEVHAPQC